MAYEIVWSAEARHTYLAIIEYLNKEWSEKEVSNFVLRVHNKLILLSAQPAIGRVHKRKYKVHITLVHKNVSLVYHIRPLKKEIVLLSFWDNRQDPAKFKH
ncbi:MAG: hypothetical protein K0Q79_288 [Flavipsychrobacter sp.]|jgi:plasmid stabilization system protein ParE|nr:hypothetical protein [Flavipsychrobacter sp.]